ncbi:MAG: MBOAT family protein [Planctomycetes bacterium]|nr:MBOAT family protein [Planctomycetota bacterium]
MLFNSFVFVLFLAVVFTLDRLTTRWTLRKLYLLIASYLFYAAWYPPFLILLWIPTLTNWYAARLIAAATKPHVRRAILATSLCCDLGMLAFFKYADLLWDMVATAIQALGVDMETGRLNILLPVGISFYLFQAMSYTIDVYRRHIVPWRSFLDFALYVAFFPQLVAGPILRAGQFLPQCERERRANSSQVGWGLTLLTMGLFHKVVLADAILAPVVDQVFGARRGIGCAEAWLGSLAFGSQVFFDFSGYSSCAIGVALLLGWEFPDNFRFPFAALGFSDFWRRWHISLSTWLKDYLYVPLGGNRRGDVRTFANLMTTMLLGGLWHGASWKFVIWGGLHGALLVLERAGQATFGIDRMREGPIGRAFLWAATSFMISFTWPFFRAPDFASAVALIESMLSPASASALNLSALRVSAVVAIIVGMMALHGYMRDRSTESVWGRLSWPFRSLFLAAMILSLLLVPGDTRAFIYFQF